MTNEISDRLFVIDYQERNGKELVQAVSLINDMKSPWVIKEFMSTVVDWGERHQRYHERLLGALEGIADYMPPR